MISANYEIPGRVGNNLVRTDIFDHHRKVPTLTLNNGGQDAMLTLALCSFIMTVGKYFLKITHPYLPRFLSREWLASRFVWVVEIPDNLWNCHLDSRKKLINAMLQKCGPAMPLLAACLLRIALGPETKRVTNFSHRKLRLEMIPLMGNKVSSRNRFRVNEDQNLLLGQQEALNQIATRVGVSPNGCRV